MCILGAERQSAAQCTDSEPDPQPAKDNAIPQKNVPESSNGLFKVPVSENVLRIFVRIKLCKRVNFEKNAQDLW